MARLQILELPEGAGDDRPPFILVIDEVDDGLAEDIARWPDDIANRTGARHILCFTDTIEIPANNTTAYLEAAASSALPTGIQYEFNLKGEPATWAGTDEAKGGE